MRPDPANVDVGFARATPPGRELNGPRTCEWLWKEWVIRPVANLTRRAAREFLALAPSVPVRSETISYRLAQANEALRDGGLTGTAVLVASVQATAAPET